MQVKKIADVPAQPVEIPGAQDVTVKVVFGPQDGAPNFALRQFDLAPGGCTPHHSHPFEHEIIVLDGQIILVTEQDQLLLSPRDAVLVMPDEKHQFHNSSSTASAAMLCLVPVEYQK